MTNNNSQPLVSSVVSRYEHQKLSSVEFDGYSVELWQTSESGKSFRLTLAQDGTTWDSTKDLSFACRKIGGEWVYTQYNAGLEAIKATAEGRVHLSNDGRFGLVVPGEKLTWASATGIAGFVLQGCSRNATIVMNHGGTAMSYIVDPEWIPVRGVNRLSFDGDGGFFVSDHTEVTSESNFGWWYALALCTIGCGRMVSVSLFESQVDDAKALLNALSQSDRVVALDELAYANRATGRLKAAGREALEEKANRIAAGEQVRTPQASEFDVRCVRLVGKEYQDAGVIDIRTLWGKVDEITFVTARGIALRPINVAAKFMPKFLFEDQAAAWVRKSDRLLIS